MTRKKIAPAIEAVLDWDISPHVMAHGAVNAYEVREQARRELRDVRAVVRAAQGLRFTPLHESPWGTRVTGGTNILIRALARLERGKGKT